jgi:ApbE family
MGTYWSIDIAETGKSFPREYLSKKIIDLIDSYDRTFSDWREGSELKMLEKKDLRRYQKPSSLFLRGLEYSKLAYEKSEGEFDITVGAVLWKQRRKKVGLNNLVLDKNGFYFKINPQRLTFGGIVKGMACGALSAWLYQQNITNFRINGGDGNLALSGKNFNEGWIEEQQIGKIEPSNVVFLSRSNYIQNKRIHIIGKKRGPDSVIITCGSSQKKIKDWERMGALSDAYSTALVLNSALDWGNLGCKTLN